MSPGQSRAQTGPRLAIAVGGGAAGLFDLAGAIAVYWPAPPAGILRSIAAGAMGTSAARSGGAGMAALGLVLHFVVAFGAASIFVAACRVAPALARRPWLLGPLYGLAVFLAMNYVVIPLSAIGRWPGPWTGTTLLVVAVHLAGVARWPPADGATSPRRSHAARATCLPHWERIQVAARVMSRP